MTLQEMLHNMATKTSFNDAEVDALDHAFATATDQEVHDAVMGLSPVLAKQGKDEKDNFHRLNQRLAVRPGFQQAIPRLHTWREAHPVVVVKDPVSVAQAWDTDDLAISRLPYIVDKDLHVATARMGYFLKHLAPEKGSDFKKLCLDALKDPGVDKYVAKTFWTEISRGAAWKDVVERHPSFATILDDLEGP